jgi:hypothetical protein
MNDDWLEEMLDGVPEDEWDSTIDGEPIEGEL